MRKLFLVCAAIVPLSLALLFIARNGKAAEAKREPSAKLETTDEILKRYPAREMSSGAQTLIRLAAAAGVDIGPRNRQSPSRVAIDPRRELVSDYVDAQLKRVDDGVDPAPPQLAALLRQHDDAIANVRALLLSHAVIVWPMHLELGSEAPLPNLYGHLYLTRTLIAHALDAIARGDSVAWEDLYAAWRLQKTLWDRPEIISRLIALSGTRLVNAAMRKPNVPAPAWREEIRQIDAAKSMLVAFQVEAWRLYHETQEWTGGADELPPSFRGVVARVIGPYELLCAANERVAIRQAASEIASLRTCATAGADFERRFRDLVPWWNFPGRTSAQNLSGIWQRVASFRAEREGTDRVIALKTRRAASPDHSWPASAPDLTHSDCSDGVWSYTRAADGTATLRFTRDIPVPGPRGQRAFPLTFVGK